MLGPLGPPAKCCLSYVGSPEPLAKRALVMLGPSNLLLSAKQNLSYVGSLRTSC